MEDGLRRHVTLKLIAGYSLAAATIAVAAVFLLPRQADGIVLGAALVILPVVWLHLLLSARVIRPLKSVAEAARRFTEGDFSVRVMGVAGGEIGELASAFNSMAVHLEAKIQELEASRSQIEGILQSMTEGVFVVDPSGRLTLINPAAQQILQVGSGPNALFKEAIRYPEFHLMAEQVLKKGYPAVQDVELFTPMERNLRVYGTRCRSAGGEPSALFVIHDVTEFRRLEQVRRDFVANVSHELKTPLTVIRGAVETLLEGALNEENGGRPFVELISEESERLGRLVDDLLGLAQIESKGMLLTKQQMDVKRFLSEEIERHKGRAKAAGVSMTLEMKTPLQTLMADREQAGRAVSNLLDNAIKYNRPGGTVIVRASVRDGAYRVDVEDTGIGIPPEQIGRIFERFYRVDKARSRETGSTGLGLAIVKHVMEAHGGFVQVESRPGEGSRFTLLFPLV
ncbi:MAG: ATP-binding protein [Candidatus Omnitrophica bacterium]|nr:ATP-binding protein [Candidatus Omnitrophota bacterium]